MNNSSKTTVFLAFCSLFVIITASMQLASVKEDVSITQTVLHGETASVKDFLMNLSTYDTAKNKWELQIPLSSAESSEITYIFQDDMNTETMYQQNSLFHLGIGLSRNANFQSILNFEEIVLSQEAPHLLPLYQALSTLAESTELGETKSEIIKLADYYDFYPISYMLVFSSSPMLSHEDYPQLTQYFQFPVHPKEELKLTIVKNMEGVESCNFEFYGDYSSDILYFTLETENEIYVATQLVTEESQKNAKINYETNLTKMSLIEDRKGNLTVEVEPNLLTLESSKKMKGMVDLGETIAILYSEDENSKVVTYQKDNFAKLKEIDLNHDSDSIIEIEGGFLTKLFESGEFTVLELVNKEIQVALTGIFEEISLQTDSNTYFKSFYFFHQGVLTVVQELRSNYDSLGDILVKVYDENGLFFSSCYEISQSVKAYNHKIFDFIQLSDTVNISSLSS